MTANKETMFICSICKSTLMVNGNEAKCKKNHSFDVASAGYINLLRSNSSSHIHGDDKEMVNARKRFLDKGYYAPMREALCEAVDKYTPENCVVLDAGCGEGYYTSEIAELRKMIAVDISKNAVISACKRIKNIDMAVASVYELPLADSSVDALVSVFSPFAIDEFVRILKPNGMIFSVIPLSKHLFSLKSAIYDTPYLNEVQDTVIDGFELIYEQDIIYSFTMDSNQTILDLFTMTPYYYRTPKRFAQRLEALNELTDEAQFKLLVYRKK